MDPTDEQLVRLGHPGRSMQFGIAAVALLLLAAIAKPWPIDGSAAPTPSGSPVGVAAATPSPTAPAPTPTRTPSAAHSDWDSTVCASPDGWRIVADQVERGRSVRAWLMAGAVYSMVPPIRSTIPITPLVSGGLSGLGFCAPAGVSEHGKVAWSGTLWRQGAERAGPVSWQPVARLTPLPGSLGAVAEPLNESPALWPPGYYVLEARIKGQLREAWIGLTIQSGL